MSLSILAAVANANMRTDPSNAVKSTFHTFRVYVKKGINVVEMVDCDLNNVERVKAELRAEYPAEEGFTVREKTMQNG